MKKFALFLGLFLLFLSVSVLQKPEVVEAKTLSQLCTTIKGSINVKYIPTGKRVWVGCDGDSGPLPAGYEKYIDPHDHVCKATKNGKVSTIDWCKGEVKRVASTGSFTLTHCSCPPNADGCLKVLITSGTLSMVNACGSRPTVPTGLQYFAEACRSDVKLNGKALNYSQLLNHTVPPGGGKRVAGLCGSNDHTIKPKISIVCTTSCNLPAPVVKITCPTPGCSR